MRLRFTAGLRLHALTAVAKKGGLGTREDGTIVPRLALSSAIVEVSGKCFNPWFAFSLKALQMGVEA
jgi:hypothetical protein